MIFDSIRESVEATAARSKCISEHYEKHRNAISGVARALAKIEDKVITATATETSIDLSISGDRHVLKAIFGAFRKLGYVPTNRPGTQPVPAFTCFWSHPNHDCRFWLSFTSSQCTRVLVRTETKEVDVYETVCE